MATAATPIANTLPMVAAAWLTMPAPVKGAMPVEEATVPEADAAPLVADETKVAVMGATEVLETVERASEVVASAVDDSTVDEGSTDEDSTVVDATTELDDATTADDVVEGAAAEEEETAAQIS